ncbi:hypothetical protein C0991_008369, partial [Blastosporella zonata]
PKAGEPVPECLKSDPISLVALISLSLIVIFRRIIPPGDVVPPPQNRPSTSLSTLCIAFKHKVDKLILGPNYPLYLPKYGLPAQPLQHLPQPAWELPAQTLQELRNAPSNLAIRDCHLQQSIDILYAPPATAPLLDPIQACAGSFQGKEESEAYMCARHWSAARAAGGSGPASLDTLKVWCPPYMLWERQVDLVREEGAPLRGRSTSLRQPPLRSRGKEHRTPSHTPRLEGRLGPSSLPYLLRPYRIKILPQPYKPLCHPVLESEKIEVEERAVRVGPRVQGVQEARELEC